MRGFATSAASWSAWVVGSFSTPAAARSFFFQVPGSAAIGDGGTRFSSTPATPEVSSAVRARYGFAEASETLSSTLAWSAPSSGEPTT